MTIPYELLRLIDRLVTSYERRTEIAEKEHDLIMQAAREREKALSILREKFGNVVDLTDTDIDLDDLFDEEDD